MNWLRKIVLGALVGMALAVPSSSPLRARAVVRSPWQIREMYQFDQEDLARNRANDLRRQGYIVWEFVWDHHFCVFARR
jgi:hypothetical protein